MVKRITGLAAGAHTITLTITGKDGANSALFVHGIGMETLNPTTPVVWCNIARTPSQSGTFQNNSVALNASSQGVIQGPSTLTATATNGSTTLTFPSANSVAAGQTVTGAGITSATVSSVNYSTGVVTITGTITTLTTSAYVFTNPVRSGNTAEPTLGSNVIFVDIDTLFGGATPNPGYFLSDGLHLNSRGHRLMARTLFSTIVSKFSADQLIAR
jgi:hypothetical protein